MKILQNKFFIVCLAIALVLCAVPITFNAIGFPLIGRNIVVTILSPFRFCVNAVQNGFEGLDDYFTGVNQLSKENDALVEENQLLSTENQKIELLESENERLKSYLGIKTDHPDYTLEEAAVVGREGDNLSSTLTLNRGTAHGIKTGMAVITKAGVVGKVTETGLNWCRVITILEPTSSVGAYIPRSGTSGTVSGEYELKNQNLCKLSYTDSGADIQVGDLVYTSGTGSVYPADLLVGTVESTSSDAYSRTVTANIKPAVNLQDLQFVLIVKTFQSGN